MIPARNDKKTERKDKGGIRFDDVLVVWVILSAKLLRITRVNAGTLRSEAIQLVDVVFCCECR